MCLALEALPVFTLALGLWTTEKAGLADEETLAFNLYPETQRSHLLATREPKWQAVIDYLNKVGLGSLTGEKGAETVSLFVASGLGLASPWFDKTCSPLDTFKLQIVIALGNGQRDKA